MLKKTFSLMLAIVILLVVFFPLSFGVCAENNQEKADTLKALNAVLIGLTPDFAKNPKTVSGWNGTMICKYIETKLKCKDYNQTDFISKFSLDYKLVDHMGIPDGGEAYDLSAVQDLTKDVLGVDFPQEPSGTNVAFSENTVIFPVYEIDLSYFSVQDYIKTKDKVVAIGTVVYDIGGGFSEFGGYFHAEFRPNPGGVYGYTLSAIYKIEGNQDSGKLMASASSELSDVSGTHHAKYLVDEMYDTVWTENVAGVGVNEWVELRTNDGSKMGVLAIQLAIGHQKSNELMKANGYPTRVRIECDNGYTQEAEFSSPDSDGIIRLNAPQEINSVRITILDAEAGDRYEDTCISEIFLRGLDSETYFKDYKETDREDEAPEKNAFIRIVIVILVLVGIVVAAYGFVIFAKNAALYKKS